MDQNDNTGLDVNMNEFLQSSNIIDPLTINEISTSWLNTLYQNEYEYLTQDEFILLDFIGVNGLMRSGSITMSFQGLKRLIALHQARLTKAINRLSKKDLLKKENGGYTLTEEGLSLFNKLYGKFERNIKASLPFIHVASGHIQGIILDYNSLKEVAGNLKGKWFSKYRYISSTQYENAFEISWISTTGSVSANLRMGPGNEIKLSISTKLSRVMNNEITLLMDHISQLLESLIDAPVVFSHHSIYEGMTKKHLQDDEAFPFAG